MDLSILVPSRNEMFLAKTIENILENIEGDTEVIAVCDGAWPDPPVKDHPRVTLIHHSKSIGQRAATNEAAKLSRATFIMKSDAHCAFDKGFDVKLMADIEYDWTVVPRMYNLHAFNWKCKKCGGERYQGPTPTSCPSCDNKTDFERIILWKEKRNPTNDHYRFDSDLHFQYWGDFKKRPEAKADLVPTMSLLGACWFMYRQRYWDLDGLDEVHGSWGQVGTEVACKTWLSGGQLLTNKKTWFSHMFRTQGGDFSFPYPNPGIKKARQRSRELWVEGKWSKAKYPLSWLLEKFAPIPGWDDKQIKETKKIRDEVPSMEEVEKPEIKAPEIIVKSGLTKGLVYYTDNQCDELIVDATQKQLLRCNNGYPIISVSLKPIQFGENIVLNLERSILTMFKQILEGIRRSNADILFLVEHDIIYHPVHFNFVPPRKDTFYYNENRWMVDTATGRALFYNAMSVSQMCGYRELLLEHYTKRVERVEKEGFTLKMGYEPGGHRYPRGIDNYGRLAFCTPYPNLDLRHPGTVSPTRWKQEHFRNKGNLWAWTEAEEVPYWGRTKGRMKEFLDGIRGSN